MSGNGTGLIGTAFGVLGLAIALDFVSESVRHITDNHPRRGKAHSNIFADDMFDYKPRKKGSKQKDWYDF